MNLTKDELQIILLDMDINIKNAPPLRPSPIYIELRNKVESMINNYCEHHWQHGGADCIVCTKCEKEIFYHPT